MTLPLVNQALAEGQRRFHHAGIIRIIVRFPPGCGVDPIARMAQPPYNGNLAPLSSSKTGPAHPASLGTGLVAESPPDGNTWVLFDSHAVNPFLFDLKFDTVKILNPSC